MSSIMLTCNEVNKLISAFVDDELNEALTGRISQHLHSCSNCRNRVFMEFQIKHFIKTNCKTYQTPSSLKEKIMEKIFQYKLNKTN